MKSITFDDFAQNTYAEMKIVACKYMDSDCKRSERGLYECMVVKNAHLVKPEKLYPPYVDIAPYVDGFFLCIS